MFKLGRSLLIILLVKSLYCNNEIISNKSTNKKNLAVINFLLYLFLPALEHSLSHLLMTLTLGTGVSKVNTIEVVICLSVVCSFIVVGVEIPLCNEIDASPAKACSPSTVSYKAKSYTCSYKAQREAIAGHIVSLLWT